MVAVSCWDTDQQAYLYCKDDGLEAEMLGEITDSYGSIDKLSGMSK